MRARIGALCAVAGGLSGLLVPSALAQATPDPFLYALDDGTGNYTIGPSQFDANMTWMNTFTVERGREQISRIQVAFGSILDDHGEPGSDVVTVAVLDDPTNDGDPSDAVLVGKGTGTWVPTLPNTFLEFELERPVRINGRFFVAVMMDVRQRANPARMDPQGQGGGARSWMFYNPEPNLDDLGSSPYVLRMSDSPFAGAWMIRAMGTAPDVCVADFAEPMGVLNFFDVAEFVSLYGAGNAAADLAAPFGTLNFFDVSAFIAAYNAGCP